MEKLSQADLLRALKAEAAKGARDAERRFKAQHPDAVGLRVKADILAFKSRGKEQREAAVRVVAMFLNDPALIDKTNAEVVAALIRHTGVKVPPSILTEKFGKRRSERVAEVLAMRKVVLDLSVHNTPSKVKLALRARRNGGPSPTQHTVTFSFTPEAVVVDDKVYPVHGEGSLRRIDVRSKKLNADTLRRLVTGEE